MAAATVPACIIHSLRCGCSRRAPGREFWENAFGRRVIVPWEEFVQVFSRVHPFCSEEEASAFKTTIDLLENFHISWFEFDIFTRCFQPWKQLLNNWNVIVIRHPAYKAFMTYDEVQNVLADFTDKPGSYVFRLSCTRLGQWAIGFVTPTNTIVQTIPQSKSLYQALIDGAEDGTYIFPCGQDINPDIRQQIRVAPEEHVKVSKEQYDIYCDMDSTFEMCKICNSNLKRYAMKCPLRLCPPALFLPPCPKRWLMLLLVQHAYGPLRPLVVPRVPTALDGGGVRQARPGGCLPLLPRAHPQQREHRRGTV